MEKSYIAKTENGEMMKVQYKLKKFIGLILKKFCQEKPPINRDSFI